MERQRDREGRYLSDEARFRNAYVEYLAGQSLTKVAKEIGTQQPALSRAFRRRGWKIRPRVKNELIVFGGRNFTRKSNGYFYSTTEPRVLLHRAVWEDLHGLLPAGKVVHHVNGDKGDNRPENLGLFDNNGAHSASHRGVNSTRRLPGQMNQEVECACGCGARFPMFDGHGRLRTCAIGHVPDRTFTCQKCGAMFSAAVVRQKYCLSCRPMVRRQWQRRGELLAVNPMVDCACGCGQRMLLVDAFGRARRFIHGHNGRITGYWRGREMADRLKPAAIADNSEDEGKTPA